MTIHLPEELERSIRAEVQDGHFSSVDEAIAEAWRTYQARPASDLATDARRAPAPAVARVTSLPILAGRHADAGLASYTAGLVVAAAFMALSLGPGWLGFVAGFLPVSLLTSWAAACHA
jgi:Arc/MetJ-type ribon-helix-helix transcriptional regulator